MKRLVKICCIVLALGFVLWGTGFAMGGRPLSMSEIPGARWMSSVAGRTVRRMINRFDHPRFWDDRYDDYDYDHDYDYNHDYDYDDDYGYLPDLPELPDLPDLPNLPDAPQTSTQALSPEDYESVRRIELDLGEGEFFIREANDESGTKPFTVEGDYFRHYRAGIDGDQWKADLQGDHIKTRSPIVIYLPPATEFDEIEIDLGAATLTTDALSCKEFELSVGAGSASIGYLNSTKIKVEAGAGAADLMLPGSWLQYGYDAEVGMGSIEVNGSRLIAGLAGKAKREGTPFLDLETGAGSITISTENE